MTKVSTRKILIYLSKNGHSQKSLDRLIVGSDVARQEWGVVFCRFSQLFSLRNRPTEWKRRLSNFQKWPWSHHLWYSPNLKKILIIKNQILFKNKYPIIFKKLAKGRYPPLSLWELAFAAVTVRQALSNTTPWFAQEVRSPWFGRVNSTFSSFSNSLNILSRL